MQEQLFGLTPTAWIALLTVVLAGVAIIQARIYAQIRDHTKVVERAYVSMSHDPPGVHFVPHQHAIQASVAVVNSGHTPADVLEARWVVALTPQDLADERGRQPPARTGPIIATIMPNDHYRLWQHIALDQSVIDGLHPGGQQHLWLVGSVTYLDRFDKKRTRHWYGRRFIHQPLPGSNNNLVFMGDHPEFSQEEHLDG